MSEISIRVPQAAQYGRREGGADAAREEWWGMRGSNDQQQAAAQRAGQWAQQQGTSGTGAQAQENPYLADQAASRAGGHQTGAIGMAQNLAYGYGPSQSAYQLQRGLDTSSAQQTAIGRSARGGAALATAGQNQQANTANLQQNAFTQGGLLRARDMAAGRQLYSGLLGQQREQDAARLGMANEMEQFNAGQQDKYRLGMGQATLGFGDVANQQDQLDFGYYQQGMNPINAQTEAYQQYQSWLANVQRQKAATNTAAEG